MPRVLLKKFSANPEAATPQIFAFDKKTSRSFKTSINNICLERDFYGLSIADSHFSAEEIFTKAENQVAPVFEKVLDRESLSCLNEQDEDYLICFIALQQTRSVGNRARLEALGKAVQSRFVGENLGIPFVGSEDEKKLSSMRAAFRLIDQQRHAFGLKTKVLFRNETSKPFILGDEPVVLHNAKDLSPYGNLGIMVPGIEIYMPLSSKFLMGFWCPSHREAISGGVRKCQTLRALSIMGATAESRNHAAEELAHSGEACKRLAAQLDAIDNKEPLSVDLENVVFFNSLQVGFAERYLMARDDEFDLPKRMIASNASYQSGLRFSVN